MSDDSLSDKPFDRASELLMKFAQRETVAKAPVVATQHEVTPAPVVQMFEPRPFTLQAGGEGQAGAAGSEGTTTKEVLILNNTDTATATSILEISTAVSWPDGTACTVDIGDQDGDIGFLGYRITSGVLFLRWLSFQSSGGSVALSGNDITITAFL